MYFPYLRGRQYEVIALRELVENDLISDKVIPVVEPVKLSATLIKTIKAFVSKEREIVIVCNPEVGNIADEFDKKEKEIQILNQLMESKFVRTGYIVTEDLRSFIEENRENKEEVLLILNNRDNVRFLSEIYNDGKKPKYLLIPDGSNYSSITQTFMENVVILADKFNKKNRNSDYEKNDDEFFSDLVFSNKQYKGFADYSIVGEGYSESGFAPYAVAIHIIYKQNNELRVHHFVSDSNEDIQNPAGKFYEALNKLYSWYNINKCRKTKGMSYFLEHKENETYPGLGSVKKYSIMHHLELVSDILRGRA